MHDTQIERLARCGMICLRGDLGAEWVPDLLSIMGFALPETRRLTVTEAGLALWMSPDELLLQCDPDVTDVAIGQMQAACAEAQVHALVADVSDMRARFEISGPGAALTLAKLCPVDLAPAQFPLGEVRRTRLAQVACGFWKTAPDRFELVCFGSVADYVETALENAAQSFEGLSL